MKLAKKVWIIIAICFVVVGATISTVSLAKFDFDFTRLDSQKFTSNEYQISEYFNGIDIDVNTSDIELVRSDNTNCTVVCIDEDKVIHNVSVVNDTLTISMQDNRQWYDHIGLFSFDKLSITVHLPSRQYDSLKIESNTGSINIPEFVFGRVEIETDTGDVDFSANVLGELDISTDTGIVAFGNIEAQDMTIESDTGNITFSSVECKKINIESNTANVRLNNTVASEKILIKTNTGDVTFNNSDGNEISVKTHTGNISGNLLSQKVFTCNTDTGSISVPETTKGGKCEIVTDTGDINITTAK